MAAKVYSGRELSAFCLQISILLKAAVPLDDGLYLMAEDAPTEEEKKLLDSLVSRDEQNPEELLIDRENVERIEKAIESELSSFERQVLDLYLTGMKYTEIARVLGKDDKSTDNALQRCRSKIRKALLTGKD